MKNGVDSKKNDEVVLNLLRMEWRYLKNPNVHFKFCDKT